jgi:dihydrofolate reductase
MLLSYHVATSVDGFIARADGSYACFPPAEDSAAEYFAALDGYSHVLMGRKTYEVGLPHGVTDPYPKLESYLVSTTLERSPDPKVTVVRDDVVAFVATLKAREGRGIYLCGGGALAGTLMSAGLVDTLIVKQHPVLIGDGIPLSTLRAPRDLVLEASKVHPSGVVVLRYAVGEAVTR